MSQGLVTEDAERLEECLADGGVAVFPTDTVYGVCCDPENEEAVQRLFKLKGRPSRRACAVMFFSLDAALRTMPELLEIEREALTALLPGPVTLLLPNRGEHFLPACRTDPTTVGLRVPALPAQIAALKDVSRPLMQSSANLSGGPDARTLEEVPSSLLEGADLVIDGGKLGGAPSTVIDLRDFGPERRWHLLREGPLERESVQEKLGALS
jgi:L-threonylcarbamoyladenylate synthase